MRLTVVTNNKMIGLGILAKDIFAERVLKLDEDGKSFDVIQLVESDTLEKIKGLPIEYGITQDIKDGIIKAFEEMSIGTKFLCVDDWVTDYKGDRAKGYWQIQKYINKGMKYKEAVEKANNMLANKKKKN